MAKLALSYEGQTLKTSIFFMLTVRYENAILVINSYKDSLWSSKKETIYTVINRLIKHYAMWNILFFLLMA